MTDTDTRIAVYTQDGEFYRHNDSLKWSRFQTIFLLEGAVLYPVSSLALGICEKRVWMIFGFLLVLALCLLALKDENDQNGHERRMTEFETEEKRPFQRITCPPVPSGTILMWSAIIVITVFNILFLVNKW